MINQKKLQFVLKKLVQSFSSVDLKREENLNSLMATLCETHTEYQFESKHALKKCVLEALNSISVSTDESQTKVNSLNQTLVSRYANASSKRQRPVEDRGNESDSKDGEFPIKGGQLVPDAAPPNEKPLNPTSSPVPATKRVKSKEVNGTATEKRKSSDTPSPVNEEATKDDITETKYLFPRPKNRMDQMAGLESVVKQVEEMVFFPVRFPKLYTHLGVRPPCGLLLHGPSGCGKTALALSIAGQLGLPFLKASGPELIGGTSGESEERVRDVFAAAARLAPSVLFIDSLDVIASKKEGMQRGMDRRVVAQLCDSIDSISTMDGADDEQQAESESKGRDGPLLSPDGRPNNGPTGTGPDRVPEAMDPTGDDGRGNLAVTGGESVSKIVILIAATNKAEALDVGVRGRFSRELALPVPDAPARAQILAKMVEGLRLGVGVDLAELARATPGFVGADLRALVREAGMNAVTRIVADGGVTQLEAVKVLGSMAERGDGDGDGGGTHTCEPDDSHAAGVAMDEAKTADGEGALDVGALLEHAYVEMHDLVLAVRSVQPSAKREGFAIVPDVTWSDVGALAEVREELLHNILEPISHPERFRSLGLDVPAGVLFFGPPGCGKTLLAKAVANQSGANFISVKGPELLNMYVGESESRVRQVFARARASAPCVIFFDELDALCPKRGMGFDGGSGSGVSERVVNQLLTELDGLEVRKDVYIIAATNRLELIDDAMLRPGRLGKLLYVPLPSPRDRVGILRALVRKVNLNMCGDGRVDLDAIGQDPRAEGFTGADLSALVREAGLAVVREWRTARTTHVVDESRALGTENGVDSGASPAVGAVGPIGAIGGVAAGAGSVDETVSPVMAGAVGIAEVKMDTLISARHFEVALRNVRPSVTAEDRIRYERVQHFIKQGLGAVAALRAAASTQKITETLLR